MADSPVAHWDKHWGRPVTLLPSMPPPPMDEPMVVKPIVEVAISMLPQRQHRLSVLFRGLLSVPLFIWVALRSLIGALLLFAGWWVAVFTGQLPEFIFRFVLNTSRISLNTAAYSHLLVGSFPGFHSRDNQGLACALDLIRVPQRRSSIFFRWILVFPGSLLTMALRIGSLPLLVANWCATLVRGRSPIVLHQALALTLRLGVRLSAFANLLTPIQPWTNWLGDPAPRERAVTSAANVMNDNLASASSSEPPIHLWRMSALPATRTLMVTQLVAGIVLYGTYTAVAPRIDLNFFSTFIDRSIVTQSYHSSQSAALTFAKQRTACSNITCVQSAAGVAETATLNSEDFSGISSRVANLSTFHSFHTSLESLVLDYIRFANASTTASVALLTDHFSTDVENLFLTYQRLRSSLK